MPSRTSTFLGAAVLLALSAAIWFWLPGLRGWLVAALAGWYVVVLLLQLALGHRGVCLFRRTGHWFFGPFGALIDPTD